MPLLEIFTLVYYLADSKRGKRHRCCSSKKSFIAAYELMWQSHVMCVKITHKIVRRNIDHFCKICYSLDFKFLFFSKILLKLTTLLQNNWNFPSWILLPFHSLFTQNDFHSFNSFFAFRIQMKTENSPWYNEREDDAPGNNGNHCERRLKCSREIYYKLDCMHNTISMTYELKFNNAHDNDDEEEEENFNLCSTIKIPLLNACKVFERS